MTPEDATAAAAPAQDGPGRRPDGAGRRLSATVVVTPLGPWSTTRRCLEALRPTLRLRDDVVVVDTGADPQTTAALAATGWVTVVPSEPSCAPEVAARNAGAAAARGDVVVFLDGDTVVTSHWLERLLAPLAADDTVAAAGPRTNYATTEQQVLVPYDEPRSSDISRFARTRRQAHRGAQTSAPVLDGFCLAVRRSALLPEGAFDASLPHGVHAATELSLRLRAAGRGLAVVEDAFVHRAGTAQDARPDWVAQRQIERELLVAAWGSAADVVPRDVLLSACLIVKDEQERLPDCLASLSGLVDEIVVYDTGSTDGTVALALAAGARVVEGFWDDDFSRARNAALGHCTGQWVLHVDADEAVEGDPDDIREELRRRVGEDVASVRIDNLDDDGIIARSHRAIRVFRRLRGHWKGHLHEQVVPRSGEPLRTSGPMESLVLRHVGYTSEVIEGRDKRDRNVRVAGRGVDSGGVDPAALVNLGRALTGAGRHAEALERFAQVRTVTRQPAYLRFALRHGAEILINEGRCQEALEWVEALRSNTSSTTVPDYLAGLAHLALGDADTALRLFEGLEDLVDETSALPEHVLLSRRGLTYVAAGRFSEAADELRSALEQTRAWAALWVPLVGSCWNSGRSLQEAVDLVPEADVLSVLAHSLNLTAEISDAMAEQFWCRWPGDARLLAYVSRVAGRLPLQRALEWSARLRAAGLDDCPLLALAGDVDRDAVERLQAAAVCVEVFADPRCGAALSSAAADVDAGRFLEALSAVDQVSPRSLGAVVQGAATTAERAAAMADLLRSLGADEQADALLLASA